MTIEGGVPLRRHLQIAERRFRRQDPRLHRRCPVGAEHVWGWFLDLLGVGGRDDPLSFSEIEAWARLSGVTIRPEEVARLRALDGVYLRIFLKGRGNG